MRYLVFAFLVASFLGYGSFILFKEIRKDLINDTNIIRTEEYKTLESQLKSWCDQYYVVYPELKIRFNKSNEGYYQTNLISLLITKEDFVNNENIPYLTVMMAHEFGHHLVRIKIQENIPVLLEERLADLVAMKMVGYESMEKVFIKESLGLPRKAEYPELDILSRLNYLKKVNLKETKVDELFQKFFY